MDQTSRAPTTPVTVGAAVPLLYRLFFLYIEPVATAAGAWYAWLQQDEYLRMTEQPLTGLATAAASGVATTLTRESMVLNQLANMYAAFALNEALVLRATSDRRVWRVFLFVLLLADFGHLHSVHLAGRDVYTSFATWNAMYWGNLGFVYVGALMRTMFLLGVGLGDSSNTVMTSAQKRQ